MWQLRNKFSMNKTHSTVLNRLSGVQIWTGQSGNQRDRTGKIYPVPDNIVSINFLWPPCGIGQAIIFLSCGFFLYIVFSSPILSGQRLDVYHTFTHDVALVRVATVWLRVNLRTFKDFQLPFPGLFLRCTTLDSVYLMIWKHYHTATILRPFSWHHPGEPVPKENFWTLWFLSYYVTLNYCTSIELLLQVFDPRQVKFISHVYRAVEFWP